MRSMRSPPALGPPIVERTHCRGGAERPRTCQRARDQARLVSGWGERVVGFQRAGLPIRCRVGCQISVRPANCRFLAARTEFWHPLSGLKQTLVLVDSSEATSLARRERSCASCRRACRRPGRVRRSLRLLRRIADSELRRQLHLRRGRVATGSKAIQACRLRHHRPDPATATSASRSRCAAWWFGRSSSSREAAARRGRGG